MRLSASASPRSHSTPPLVLHRPHFIPPTNVSPSPPIPVDILPGEVDGDKNAFSKILKKLAEETKNTNMFSDISDDKRKACQNAFEEMRKSAEASEDTDIHANGESDGEESLLTENKGSARKAGLALASLLLDLGLTASMAKNGGAFGAYSGATNTITGLMASLACYADKKKGPFDQGLLIAQTAFTRGVTAALAAGWPEQNDDWDNTGQSLGKVAVTGAIALAVCQLTSRVVLPLFSGKKPKKYHITSSNTNNPENRDFNDKRKYFLLSTLAITIAVLISDTGVFGAGAKMSPALVGAGDGAIASNLLHLYDMACDPKERAEGINQTVKDTLAGTGLSCVGDVLLQLLYNKIKDNPLPGVAGMVAGTVACTDMIRYFMDKYTDVKNDEPNMTAKVVKEFDGWWQKRGKKIFHKGDTVVSDDTGAGAEFVEECEDWPNRHSASSRAEDARITAALSAAEEGRSINSKEQSADADKTQSKYWYRKIFRRNAST